VKSDQHESHTKPLTNSTKDGGSSRIQLNSELLSQAAQSSSHGARANATAHAGRASSTNKQPRNRSRKTS